MTKCTSRFTTNELTTLPNQRTAVPLLPGEKEERFSKCKYCEPVYDDYVQQWYHEDVCPAVIEREGQEQERMEAERLSDEEWYTRPKSQRYLGKAEPISPEQKKSLRDRQRDPDAFDHWRIGQ